MTPPTPEQIEALAAVRAACPSARIALIGASALGVHVPMTWRTTADVDLILTIAIADLDARLAERDGWARDPNKEQRWTAPNGVVLDLVPAPPEALAVRSLTWPVTGLTMSLAGIELALEQDTHALFAELAIIIPPLPVIALLKMNAHMDAPDREKDLTDLANILDGYPPSGDDRFFTDELFEQGLDEDEARGWILGRELRTVIVDERDAVIVERFLDATAEGPRWSAFVRRSPWSYDERELRRRLDALRDGFRHVPVAPPTSDLPRSAP